MTPEKILEAAKFYHSLGWSVIPIKKNGKIPAFDLLPKDTFGKATWLPYETRQATQEELERWFGQGERNIALVCGEISGIAAIDDDTYKANGGQIKLASTLTQTTPRKGTHYLYRCPAGLRPSVNDEFAVDIRANGSYILVYPSTIHGVPYIWNTKKIADFRNLPPLPLTYLEKIQVHSQNESVDFSKIYGTLDGARDSNLYRAACSLLARGIPAELVYKFLLFLNSSFKPPKPASFVQQKFESAVKFLLREKGKNG